ncbi:MAG: hypothetical protein U0790_10880 [Isosphaeraceae bacterium]
MVGGRTPTPSSGSCFRRAAAALQRAAQGFSGSGGAARERDASSSGTAGAAGDRRGIDEPRSRAPASGRLADGRGVTSGGLVVERRGALEGSGVWYGGRIGSREWTFRSTRVWAPSWNGTSSGRGQGACTDCLPSEIGPEAASGTRYQVRPRRWSRQASGASSGPSRRTSQNAARPMRTRIHGSSTTRIGPDSRSWMWRNADSDIAGSTPP